tara:strand:+ start:289 stop:1086 length:798 start_codon:yes stop_codon:yes gene_type:complete
MKTIVIILLSLTVFACQQPYEEAPQVQVDLMRIPPPEPREPSLELIENKKGEARKLVKISYLEFETIDQQGTKKSIMKMVSTHRGYLAKDHEYKSNDRTSVDLEIRLPAAHLEQFMIELSHNVDKFDTKNISVNDVTEEYVDIEARLKAKREIEKTYSKLLSKALNVTEILNIEKELGTIRTDIESIEGRIRLLSNQVDYTTVNLRFYKKIVIPNSILSRIGNALKDGLDTLIWLCLAVIRYWPIVILSLLFLGIFKKIGLRKPL